mgnify:CR=1 FL=1
MKNQRFVLCNITITNMMRKTIYSILICFEIFSTLNLLRRDRVEASTRLRRDRVEPSTRLRRDRVEVLG